MRGKEHRGAQRGGRGEEGGVVERERPGQRLCLVLERACMPPLFRQCGIKSLCGGYQITMRVVSNYYKRGIKLLCGGYLTSGDANRKDVRKRGARARDRVHVERFQLWRVVHRERLEREEARLGRTAPVEQIHLSRGRQRVSLAVTERGARHIVLL